MIVYRMTKEEDLALIKLKKPVENKTGSSLSARLMKIGKASLPWKGYRANGQLNASSQKDSKIQVSDPV